MDAIEGDYIKWIVAIMISVMMGHKCYTYIHNQNDTKADRKSPGGIMGK